MEEEPWGRLIERLRSRGIEFAPALADGEVAAAESRFGFRFPPDLRAFLQTAMPWGPRFPDWRGGDDASLRDWLDLPRQGILFDVEHNEFWLPEWGPRPGSLAEARRVVDALVAAAPRLIPVFMHRMIPDAPHLPGNPVFSVHQTDIIVYGTDLRQYLVLEFLASEVEPKESTVPLEPRAIPFWDIDRFQTVRWGPDGSCVFDNSRGTLP